MSERPHTNHSPSSDGRSAGEERELQGGDILNIEEAAKLLGVSIKTFNKVLHGEDMPARKIGREWKFSRQALIDWVGSGRSRDYYRESSDQDGTVVPQAPDRRAPGPGEKGRRASSASRQSPSRQSSGDQGSHGQSRRTQGWRIELD